MKSILFFTSIIIALAGCGGQGASLPVSPSRGKVAVAITWPSGRTMPANTKSVVVQILHEATLLEAKTINKGANPTVNVVFDDVPAGQVTISAASYDGIDAGGAQTAADTEVLAVEVGATVPATLDLTDQSLTQVNITDFRTAYGEMVTNGDAELGSEGSLFVTLDDSFNVGSAFLKRAVKVKDGFECRFRFTIDSGGGVSGGGDGFALVVQSESEFALGDAGAGIGYAGITKSVAFEFDTYRNASGFGSPDYLDPSESHVAIMCNGDQANSANHRSSANRVMSALIAPALLQSVDREAVVSYRNRILSISVDGTVRAAIFLANLDQVIGSGDGKAFIGFTGATGSAWARCRVHNLFVGTY